MTASIINEIDGIENKSYLELGVGNNRNFTQIRAGRKTSVDTNGRGTFTGTTDQFFKTCRSYAVWDIIFIDANHDYEQVLKDLNNSIEHCAEWILIHDLIPPSEKYCQAKFCSDGYKLLYHLLKIKSRYVYPMDEIFGPTFIRMPAFPVQPLKLNMYVPYSEFMQLLDQTHLYTRAEMIRILNS